MNEASLVIQALAAIGTIAVAILAIWGDWVRSILIPPRLTIQLYYPRGTLTKFSSRDPDLNNKRVIYYHLKVENSRPWSPARNCSVLLRGIFARAANHEFVRIPMAVPGQFVWAPAALTPPTVTLSKEQILDFGRITEGSDHFLPTLIAYANDFKGEIRKDQSMRYALEIVADGFIATKCQVFEVAWNGMWSENLDDMQKNLTIREVTDQIQFPTTA